VAIILDVLLIFMFCLPPKKEQKAALRTTNVSRVYNISKMSQDCWYDLITNTSLEILEASRKVLKHTMLKFLFLQI